MGSVSKSEVQPFRISPCIDTGISLTMGSNATCRLRTRESSGLFQELVSVSEWSMPLPGCTISSGPGRTFGRLLRLKRAYTPGVGSLRSNASSFTRVSTFSLFYSLCAVFSSGIGVLSLLRGGISLTGLNEFPRRSLNASIHVSFSEACSSGEKQILNLVSLQRQPLLEGSLTRVVRFQRLQCTSVWVPPQLHHEKPSLSRGSHVQS